MSVITITNKTNETQMHQWNAETTFESTPFHKNSFTVTADVYAALVQREHVTLLLFYAQGRYWTDFWNMFVQPNGYDIEMNRKLFRLGVHFKNVRLVTVTLPQMSIADISQEPNQLEKLCNHGFIHGGGDIEETCGCKRSPRYGRIRSISGDPSDPISDEDGEVLEIIRAILHVFPSLVTPRCYTKAQWLKNYQTIELLKTYEVDNKPLDQCCFLCASSAQTEFLFTGICLCTSLVHISCAQKLVEQAPVCPTCKSAYKKNTPKYGHNGTLSKHVFFPSAGVYPVPLMTGQYHIVQTHEERIARAIMYLQTQHVEDGLTHFSSYASFVEKCETLFKTWHIGTFSPRFQIGTSFPSNYSYQNNSDDFELIETLINSMK